MNMKLIPYFIIASLIMLSGCKKDNKDGPNPKLNKLSLGKSANDILSAKEYDQMTIEIISVSGFELQTSQINSFKSFVESIVNKPSGVNIKTSSVTNPGLAPYSLEDLIQFEETNRTEYNDGKELTLYLFITESEYTEKNVLGLAYQNTSMAIMGGRIRALTGGIGQPSENLVLQTVLRHEIAHLMGLVNIGTAMQTNHQDVAHGKHCDVKECLMYYAVESGDFIGNLVGTNSPPELDSQCKADLKANGSK